MADDNCVVCERALRRRRRYVLDGRLLETRRDFLEQMLRTVGGEVALDGSRSICHACRHRIDAATNQERQTSSASAIVPDVRAVNVPGVRRASNTARRCLIDNCNSTQLRPVPNSIRVHLLSYHQFYVPNHARICQQHLLHMSIQDILQNVTNQLTGLNADNVGDIINMYTLALERRTSLFLDETSEHDLHFWTGHSRVTFNILLNETPSLQQSSNTPQRDLAIYLCKLRTGEPNERIAALFNLSRRTIDRKIQKVRECLQADFVPLHLGLDHITREQVIQHNRVLPNRLFGEENLTKAITICDGTYLFLEKSSNYLFQRRTYSLHKYRNLLKPFMIVCADGYILDVLGPYSARATDAIIMSNILENHGAPIEDGAFHYFFNEGDIFVLDRGFRDSIPLMESYGYDALMPPTKLRHETQLSTEAANKSRLITMVRWVVETINGRFKRDFKLFRNRVFNKNVPYIMEDFQAAAAIINCFQAPYLDSPYLEDFIESINQNIERPNLLAEYVQENNINQQRATFRRMAADDQQVDDFPMLRASCLIYS